MMKTFCAITGLLTMIAGLSMLIIFGNIIGLLAGLETARFTTLDLTSAMLILLGAGLTLPALWALSWRRVLAWIEFGVYIFFVLAVLAVIYLIAENRSFFWDATTRNYYTLSPQTRNYLQGIRTPIEIAAFHGPGEEKTQREILQTLQRYARIQPNITVRTLNPVTQPLTAAQYGDMVTPGDIFVRQLDSATTDTRYIQRIRSLDEETLTNAIVRVLQGEQVTAYILDGHGFRRGAAQQADPIQPIRDFLRFRGIRVESLDLRRGAESLQVENSIVLCIGPVSDLLPVERQDLEGYLRNGGKAFFMLDAIPDAATPDFTEFTRLLFNFGIRIRRDLVYDPELTERQQQFRHLIPFPCEIRWNPGGHSITSHMPNVTTYMSSARTVSRGEAVSPYLSVMEFLFTPAQSSYAVDLHSAFQAGDITPAVLEGQTPRALPLAAAAELRQPGQTDSQATKLVVLGDSALFTDLAWGPTQETLMANVINWLSATENTIAIPPKRPSMPPVILSGVQLRTLRILLSLILPFSILFGGLGYTIVRRRLG